MRGALDWVVRLFRNAGVVVHAHRGLFAAGTSLAAAFCFALMGLDHRIMAWLVTDRQEWALTFAKNLSYWGELHLVPALIVVGIWALGRWKKMFDWQQAAGAALFAGVVGGLVANILKFIAGRPRPSANLADGFYSLGWKYDLQSFPSGHATHCSAVAAALFVVMPRTGGVCAAVTLAVAWSRMYLDRHYPSDVLMGLWLGSMIGLIFGLAVTRRPAGGTLKVNFVKR